MITSRRTVVGPPRVAVRDVARFASVRALTESPQQVRISGSLHDDPVLVFNRRRGLWELHEPWEGRMPDGRVISLPLGYSTDLASIPRIFWNVIAPFELSIVAPLVHDALCDFKGKLPKEMLGPWRSYSRKDADGVFRDLMLEENVPSWRVRAAYAGVRSYAILCVHDW